MIRGILLGFTSLVATENLVFNVYPIYLFLGIWLGRRRPPDSYCDLSSAFSICFCVYAPAYMFFLHKLTVAMPGRMECPSLVSRAAVESLSWRCSAWIPNRVASGLL